MKRIVWLPISIGVLGIGSPLLTVEASTLMFSDGSAYVNDFSSGIGNLAANTSPTNGATAGRVTTLGSGDSTSYQIVSTASSAMASQRSTSLEQALSLYVIQFDFRPLETGSTPGLNSMYLFRAGDSNTNATIFTLTATDESGGSTYQITAGAGSAKSVTVSGLSATSWTRFVIQRTTTSNSNAYTLWTGSLLPDGETWQYTEQGQFNALSTYSLAGFFFGDALTVAGLQNGQGYWDNFSIGAPTPIPEPSSFILISGGTLLLLWKCRSLGKAAKI